MNVRDIILELKGDMSIRGFSKKYEIPFSTVQKFLAEENRKLPVGLLEAIAKNENCKYSFEELEQANENIQPSETEVEKIPLPLRGLDKVTFFTSILLEFFILNYRRDYTLTKHQIEYNHHSFCTNFELTFNDGFCWGFEYYLTSITNERFPSPRLVREIRAFIGGIAMRSYEGYDKISIVTDNKNFYNFICKERYCLSLNLSIIYIEDNKILEEMVLKTEEETKIIDKYDLNQKIIKKYPSKIL